MHVCRDLTCWLRGAAPRTGAVHERYDDDPDVEVVEVSCLGRCDVAPAVAVNDRPRARDRHRRAGRGRPRRPAGPGHGDPQAGRAGGPWPNDPYAPGEPRYRVLRSLLAGTLSGAQVVDALRDSGLRGMGGAGFPTGSKWALVAEQPATPRYVICNADESEPGTFKDRQILAEQPHLVLEGLLLGMVVVGAEQGWVFIRHEYGPEEAVVRAEIEALRAEGLLGDDVLGSGRHLSVEVFTSPGGYILGEESALIECMEGHRGEPRNKPPFPGTHGLWGRPTLMNSVETLADVPVIVEPRRAWWRDQGDRRVHRPEVLRRLRARRAARRLLRADGHHRRLAARDGRGHGRRRRPGRGPARRRVLELPRPRPARRPARLRHAGRGRARCWAPARWW